MSLLVKICGLKTQATLDTALEAGADLVGFVFFPPSPRNLDLAAARALGRHAGGRAGKVALTVDPDDSLIEAILEALRPDMIQLHGKEPPDRVVAVKQKFGLPVMKAIHIGEAGDLAGVPAYAAIADRLLFDATPPRSATRPGGLGKPFDWSLLEKFDPGVPFMLSGGLDPGNVAEALRVTQAPGVDVSSGVERAPGEKDSGKIRDFIRAVRSVSAHRATSIASTA